MVLTVSGVSYSGSTRGSGLRSLGSIPSTPTRRDKQNLFQYPWYTIILISIIVYLADRPDIRVVKS